jgi:hypothetical protein
MGTFTLQLKEVIESLYGTSMDEDDYEQEYDSFTFNGITYGKLPKFTSYEELELAYYPIFDEGYRNILNGKIIDEYYNQEIGTETIDNFLLILRKKMDQIMPYFNQLYKSTQIPYDALDAMRIHSVGAGTMEGTVQSDSTNTNTSDVKSGSRTVGSDFPQTVLSGSADYATDATDLNSDVETSASGNANANSTNSSNNSSDTLVTGYQGAASDLIIKYRNSLINIDLMVIDAIEDCFMLVLNNGDEYFAQNYGW